MPKLHAQMALFGAIDEIVSQTNDLEIVETVDAFLPGMTGPGQRGWFGELTRFMAKPELDPSDGEGNVLPRKAEPIFPDLSTAVATLKVEKPSGPPPPAPPEDSPPSPDETTPTDAARTLFASTVLSKVLKLLERPDKNLPTLPGINSPGPAPDPLVELLPQNLNSIPPSGPMPGVDPLPPGTDPQTYLFEAKNRDDLQRRIQKLAMADVLVDKAVGEAQIVCTGGLRKIDGQVCTVLTTDWQNTDLTVDDIKEVIDPHNWPVLCPDFFVGMGDQDPELSRGWTRVLERVSSDREQWELRTALRYWKGNTTPAGGIYINYDLDPDRTGDCMMVEVDAGYLMITPLDDSNPNAGIRIQTCKQVRIRGVSSTATAALACFMGWGDAASHMLTDKAKPPPPKAIKFGKVSVDPGPESQATTTSAKQPTAQQSAEAIEQAAEKAELVPGWRGALISNMQKELSGFIDVAAKGASDLLEKWSDGMTVKDVQDFGTRFGGEMTEYVAGMFNSASNAIRRPPDQPDTRGGDNQ